MHEISRYPVAGTTFTQENNDEFWGVIRLLTVIVSGDLILAEATNDKEEFYLRIDDFDFAHGLMLALRWYNGGGWRNQEPQRFEVSVDWDAEKEIWVLKSYCATNDNCQPGRRNRHPSPSAAAIGEMFATANMALGDF